MIYESMLEIAANWAAVLTAVIATVVYVHFIGARWMRRRALENHLREEKLLSNDEGRRTVVHLMANLAMTEAEVLHAGFQSRKIKAIPGVDEQGRAVRIYFEYDGKDLPQRRIF